MTNTIKILATLSEKELNEAMQHVSGSDTAKARAMKEINDYKEIRRAMEKLFNR